MLRYTPKELFLVNHFSKNYVLKTVYVLQRKELFRDNHYSGELCMRRVLPRRELSYVIHYSGKASLRYAVPRMELLCAHNYSLGTTSTLRIELFYTCH